MCNTAGQIFVRTVARCDDPYLASYERATGLRIDVAVGDGDAMPACPICVEDSEESGLYAEGTPPFVDFGAGGRFFRAPSGRAECDKCGTIMCAAYANGAFWHVCPCGKVYTWEGCSTNCQVWYSDDLESRWLVGDF